MNLRRSLATFLVALSLSLVSAPFANAEECSFSLNGECVESGSDAVDALLGTGGDSDSAQGDIIQSQCADLAEGFGGGLGCDSTDEVIDFTEYDGKLEPPSEAGYDESLTENKSAREFIQSIVNYALGFLGLISVVIVIYGGLMYVLSRGDEEMASKGKKSIGYAAIGIVIILGSYALVNTLLQAGGGDSNGDVESVDGTTITETGASFDTESVLEEIEDVSVEYVKAYQTLLTVSQEVAYMRSVEMPILLDVEETDWTLDGLLQYLIEWAEGADDDFADQYKLIDESDVEDYIDMLREGVDDIQGEVDNLSQTFEAAQALYNYLRSGTQSSILDTLWALVIPEATAAIPTAPFTVEEIITQIEQGIETSDSCASREVSSEVEREFGLGVTIYEVDIVDIDDNVCGFLEEIQNKAIADYTEAVEDLVFRFDVMQGLFDTGDFDSGSNLTAVLEAFTTASEKLNAAATVSDVNAQTANQIVASMNDLYVLVENLEFVKVRLSASTTSGNDPLIVRFDVLGTEDPSGMTVEDAQIEWDLNGDGTYEPVGTDEAPGTLNTTAVTSEDTSGDAVSATFSEPGTYRVRVRVRSKDPDIAAGVSTVTISVEPSKSMLVLTAQVGTETPATIADFRTYPYIDQNDFKVTETEAKTGILFDASGTTDGDGNTGAEGGIVYYEWDFGDNETSSGPYGQDGGSSVTHAYAGSGSYNVSFTVTDDTGIKDRKYFTLYVASPAARFKASPSEGTVDTEFDFDASGSTTENGKIVSYSWDISKNGVTVPVTNGTESTLSTVLDQPGVYSVTLTVSDGSGKTDTATGQVLVESTAPVATYEYSIPNATEPATVLFDASTTYDPDEGDVVTLEWDFDGIEGQDYEIIDTENEDKEITVQFLNEGEYAVSLTAYDQHDAELKKSDTAIGSITIDSVLDVDLDIQGETARNLDENGEAEVEFSALSETGTAFEIDYGDDTVDFTDTVTRGEAIFTHIYESAGVFEVTLTALDDEEDRNSITQRVYIGAGDSPIAVISIGSNGEDIGSGADFRGSIKTQFRFDANESVNVDGSKNGLEYSWNFGDGVTSSQPSVTHTFTETATYTVKLTVRDEDDNAITDETSLLITIEGIDPEILGLTVIPQGDSLETPLKVNVTVDATDEDGKLTNFRAWYYDLNDTATELGTISSASNTFSMTINTKGETGEALEYGFAVEVTDNQNNTVSSFDELEAATIPTLEVTNGPNDTPVAGFTVNRTSVYVGEEITFSSTSYDTDGEIVNYWWDIEGNGFFDNEPTEDGSLEYAFSQIHPEGVEVQLKVEDSSGATATSESLTIFVDAVSAAPDAAFLADINGTTVSFRNNSIIDTENGADLTGIYWDFNTAVDSNGNGTVDDDSDSFEENPSYTYEALGTYQVKMTVVDTTGQSDSVTQAVNVLDTKAPVAGFSYNVEDRTVEFKNETVLDTANGADVRSYSWDLNLTADTDGDTDPENDSDATTKNPTFEYDDYGDYEVKMLVEDTFGKTDTVIQTVEVPNPVEPVTALFTSTPQPNSLSQVILEDDGDQVTFYYGAEGGSGNFSYVLDKNIFYDTDGDGLRDNDEDYDDDSSGTWKTPFFKSYGQVVVKLTVTDEDTGESDISTLQVVFEGSLGSANLFNATPSEMMMLIVSALVTAIAGISLTFKSSTKRSHNL
ncbi:MAG: PKD domain-containing protein [Patescibacteria group bacterium]